MHVGKSYKAYEFFTWSRRRIFALVIVSTGAALLYQLAGFRAVLLPWCLVARNHCRARHGIQKHAYLRPKRRGAASLVGHIREQPRVGGLVLRFPECRCGADTHLSPYCLAH